MMKNNKEIIWCPYIPAMVNGVEKWLSEMSEQGLQLVYMNGWKFTFEHRNNAKTEYFMYSGFDASKGISYNYYRAKEKYGKKGAEINKINCSAFEVDLSKKDDEFYKCRDLRNNYYKRHYIKLFLFSLLLLAIWVVSSMLHKPYFVLLPFFAAVTLYSAVSLIILKKNT